jgi:hypothetical protein
VGATAVVPGIGTGITLALSGVETVGFVESTALFAQSVAEVHGIAVGNPDRARALVMTLMLGKEGVDLVGQLARQVTGRGSSRSAYWGELVTKSLPRAAVGPLVDQLKGMFVKQFAAKGGASFLGKAMPFGIGAAIGGAGNHILGRRVLTTSHRAFGAAPLTLPAELEPVPGAETVARRGMGRAPGRRDRRSPARAPHGRARRRSRRGRSRVAAATGFRHDRGVSERAPRQRIRRPVVPIIQRTARSRR